MYQDSPSVLFRFRPYLATLTLTNVFCDARVFISAASSVSLEFLSLSFDPSPLDSVGRDSPRSASVDLERSELVEFVRWIGRGTCSESCRAGVELRRSVNERDVPSRRSPGPPVCGPRRDVSRDLRVGDGRSNDACRGESVYIRVGRSLEPLFARPLLVLWLPAIDSGMTNVSVSAGSSC